MRLAIKSLIVLFALESTVVFATPPKADDRSVAEPPIELELKKAELHFSYDLSGLFDDSMWSRMAQEGSNEILVEVRMVDGDGNELMSQYHQLQVCMVGNKQVRLSTGPGNVRLYSSRKEMVNALSRVPGTPIAESAFSGRDGFLEVVAFLNPVTVYNFPETVDGDSEQQVVSQRVFDRSLALRSKALSR